MHQKWPAAAVKFYLKRKESHRWVGNQRADGRRLRNTYIVDEVIFIPSFVLICYLAFVLPVEISVAGQILTVPLWLKATLALTIPVIGFTSDQGLAYLRQRREGLSDARSIFAVAALQYFLIILMSSATASVIGVEDSVGRMNQMIAYETTPTLMLLGYSYIGLFFIITSLVLSRLARRLTA